MTNTSRAIERSVFREWRREPIRFSDIDVNAHVNNAAFLDIIQTPRVGFLRGLLAKAGDSGSWIVGRAVIDYLHPISFPGDLDIGTGIERLGDSSVVVVQAVFDRDVCAAVVRSTMVHLGDGRSAPIEGKLRDVLSSHIIPSTGGADRD